MKIGGMATKLGGAVQALGVRPAGSAAALKSTSVAALKARAQQLLAAPLREDFPDLALLQRGAAEESGHAVVGLALGAVPECAEVRRGEGSVTWRTLPAGASRAAIALGGSMARDARPVWAALKRNSWSDVRSAVSWGDFDLLAGSVTFEQLEEGASLAAKALLDHQESFGNIRDALLRHEELSGGDLQALFSL